MTRLTGNRDALQLMPTVAVIGHRRRVAAGRPT